MIDLRIFAGVEPRIVTLYPEDFEGEGEGIESVLRDDWEEPPWFARRVAEEFHRSGWWTVWLVMKS